MLVLVVADDGLQVQDRHQVVGAPGEDHLAVGETRGRDGVDRAGVQLEQLAWLTRRDVPQPDCSIGTPADDRVLILEPVDRHGRDRAAVVAEHDRIGARPAEVPHPDHPVPAAGDQDGATVDLAQHHRHDLCPHIDDPDRGQLGGPVLERHDGRAGQRGVEHRDGFGDPFAERRRGRHRQVGQCRQSAGTDRVEGQYVVEQRDDGSRRIGPEDQQLGQLPREDAGVQRQHAEEHDDAVGVAQGVRQLPGVNLFEVAHRVITGPRERHSQGVQRRRVAALAVGDVDERAARLGGALRLLLRCLGHAVPLWC